MSNKLILKTMLCATMILGGASVALSHNFSHSESNVETVTQKARDVSVREAASTPAFNGVELSKDQINATITSSATTELTQSYSVTFASRIMGYTFNNLSSKHLYVKITDSNYTDDDEVSGRPTFKGEAFKITDVNDDGENFVLPAKLANGRKYYIETASIGPNLVSKLEDAKKVKSIIIPETVKDIHEDAFKIFKDNNLTTTEFKILSSKGAEGLNFDESVFPTGSKITWEYTPSSKEEKIINDSKVLGTPDPFSNGFSYFIGYEKDDHKDLFLEVAYFVNDETAPRVMALPVDDSINRYDAIGAFNGKFSYDKDIDIPLAANEVVDDDRIYFLGIYSVDENNKPIVDDGAGNSLKGYVKAKNKSVRKNIDEFIDFKYNDITTYNGYTSINGLIDSKVTVEHPGVYLKFNKSSFNRFEDELKSGDKIFRTRFTSLNSSILELHYEGEDGTIKSVDYKVSSKYPYYNLPKATGANFTFLIKNSDVAPDFSADKIRSMELKNFRITIDIFNTETQKTENLSTLQTRFGEMRFVPENTEAYDVYSIDLALILTAVIFTVIYAALAVGYFLYAKNKFKNDEFRRVKPKLFAKNATIGYFGSGIVLFALMFIIFRFGILANSNVVFNPLDPLIIGFTVAAVLVIGYYVKFFTTLIKANMEKRKTEKLKLNEDVENDGTN